MNLNPEQKANKEIVEKVAVIAKIDPIWAPSVGMVESSLGLHQKSPTGAKGIFQMTSIAMKDLLQVMERNDDDIVDVLCGVAFLKVLHDRHGSIDKATLHYCDPKDRHFYWTRVQYWMEKFNA